MRLAQLSRKFSVLPAEIVDLLARHNIALEPSANAKVEGEALTIVIAHYAPQSLEQNSQQQEISVNEPPANESVETETVEPVVSQLIEEPKISEQQSQPVSEEQSTVLNGVGGVIKAPKVELKGLKVLGKIELPEPRKKEEPAPPSDEASVEEQRPVARTENRERRERRQLKKPSHDSRNPVALERERLAREAAERRKQELEREKERRKLHYHKKVVPKGPTKAVRRYEEHEAMTPETEERPKSLWGRIIRWLTT